VITVTFKPLAAGTRTALVTIVDDAPASPQAISLSGSATAPFTIAPAANTVVLVPGQSSQLGMQFTSMPNFTGTVSFTCSGAPAGSTCAISPPTLPVNGQMTTTLNLIVNSASTSTLVRPNVHNSPLPWQLAIFILLLPAIAFSQRRNIFTRARFAHLAMLLALSGCLVASACGSGTNANNAPSGPAPGAYTLTIVATSGTATISLNVTLNVQ
jgi:hypothetical protein